MKLGTKARLYVIKSLMLTHSSLGKYGRHSNFVVCCILNCKFLNVFIKKKLYLFLDKQRVLIHSCVVITTIALGFVIDLIIGFRFGHLAEHGLLVLA